MFSPKGRSFVFVLLAACIVVLGAGACGNQIGDACRTSVDCSINDIRTCDIAQPGGYCTVEGCDERSCPRESICVRVFPDQFLTLTCDPATEVMTPDADCEAEGRCCPPELLCLPSGLCAPRSTERRYCAYTCDDGSDCRDGYECRVVGTKGSVAIVPSQHNRAKFCAPRDVAP